MNRFHDWTAIPIALTATLNPVLLPTDISPWLSIAVQVGGLVLIGVQVRYWWKKSG